MNRLLLFLFMIPMFSFAQNENEVLLKQYFEDGNYTKAKQLAKQLLNKDQSNQTGHIYLGHIAGNSKDWNTAIEHYETLTNLSSNNADYYYWYGGVLGMKALENKLTGLGSVKKMKKAFHKAAELDKNHIDVRWALLETYLQLPGIIGGSYKKADAYANELARLSKTEGYLAKAYIANYKKEYNTEKKFQKLALTNCNSISKNYKRNTIHYQLGKASINNNQNLELGLKHLNWFVAKHKKSDSVAKEWGYLFLAKAYRLKNDKEKAVTYLNKAKMNKEVAKFSKKEEGLIQAL